MASPDASAEHDIVQPETTRALIERWPTGAKVFLILSIALLPIAVIAIFATLQTTHLANTEARARLRVASAESSRALSIELTADMTALRAAADALGRDPADAPSCARAQGVFAQQLATGTRFVVLDRTGTPLCGELFPGAAATAALVDDHAIAARLDPPAGLQLAVSGVNGARAAAVFPTEFLARLSRPSGFAPPYAEVLTDGETSLTLKSLENGATLERRETNRTALGLGGLVLQMQVRSAPISSPMVIAMLLPLIMWAAAASIAWFVVDRLLIRPLRRLRDDIERYRPGHPMAEVNLGAVPAQEIADLGETFQELTHTVERHEQSMADGLVRQTKLTREVHHRVKNNLQVIASLINFHARSAHGEAATDAYATIQRRVDALAVVHRHHYAEMEENRGLELKSVIGELASNIRATASGSATKLGITLNVESVLVTQDRKSVV